jgi:hypothetical protein
MHQASISFERGRRGALSGPTKMIMLIQYESASNSSLPWPASGTKLLLSPVLCSSHHFPSFEESRQRAKQLQLFIFILSLYSFAIEKSFSSPRIAGEGESERIKV